MQWLNFGEPIRGGREWAKQTHSSDHGRHGAVRSSRKVGRHDVYRVLWTAARGGDESHPGPRPHAWHAVAHGVRVGRKPQARDGVAPGSGRVERSAVRAGGPYTRTGGRVRVDVDR